jgi:rhodanese-related sulfurtransferase
MKTALQLVDEANKITPPIPVSEANALRGDDANLLVDLRDIRELWREGTIPGAIHAPRGMLEFWADPDCKYHRKDFAGRKTVVLFCASAWRSALAARDLYAMGITNVTHIGGGFSEWRKQGLDIAVVKNPYLGKS